jgi:hypothetical protein
MAAGISDHVWELEEIANLARSYTGTMSLKNRWRIPDWLAKEVFERDSSCIYCGEAFDLADAKPGSRRSWEHIVNDAEIITPENIALCCRSCNSSKGAKRLSIWLDSPYCMRRGIKRDTVAAVVKNAFNTSN